MNKFFHWIVTHPKTVLACVSLITAWLGWASLSLTFSTDLREMLPADDPTVLDFVEVSRHYGSQDFLLIAIHAEETVFNEQTLKKVWELTQALQTLPSAWVEEVHSLFNADIIEGTSNALVVRPVTETLPQTAEEIAAFRQTVLGERLLRRLLLSEDERTTLILLEERPEIINSDAAMAMTQAVQRLVAPYQGPETIYLSGGPYIMAQVRTAMVDDLKTLLPLAIAVLLLVLWASFRQLRGMLLPVSVAFLSVIWTLGLMALVGFKLTIVSVVIPVILIAIGDADAIHLLTRYQETLHRVPDKRQALLQALERLNQPILYTSFSSAAGFLGLALAYSVIIREFGVATAVGILFAMGLSLTFLPALLVLLPARNAPHLARPVRFLGGWRHGGHLRRRWLIGAFLILALSALGISHIEINNNPLDYVRSDLPVVQSAHFVEETFGGSLTLRVSLDTGEVDRWKDPAWLREVQSFQEYVEDLPHTGISSSLVDVLREINVSLHGDDPAFDVIPDDIRAVAQALLLFEFGGGGGLSSLVKPDYTGGQITVSAESLPLKLLRPLIQKIRDYLATHFPNSSYKITGQPMFGLRLGDTLITSQIVSLLFSLLLVWVMLWVLTRSLRLSLIGMVPLGLAVLVMLGVMGFLSVAIDLGTVMVASVAIGISVDFAIHFITQYQQARRKLLPEAAIQAALNLTWCALLYNTLSLGLGFLVLLFSKFTANIAFGALIGLTVVVAFIATLRLVPTLLLLTSKAKN